MHRLENSRMQKCMLMGSSPLDLYAREYFNSLNSLAEKISTDITTTVAAYEDLWHTLSIKDQHQVINETIIHPEVVLKYSLCKSEDDVKLNENSSRNLCNDEGKGIGISWTDEHSAPFSWKTKSQQDLSVFGDDFSGAVVNGNCRKSVQSMSSEKIISSPHDIFIDHPNVVLGGSSSKLSTVHPSSTSCSDNSNFLNKMKSKSVVLKIQTTKVPNKSDRNSLQNSTEISSSVLRVNGGCKISKTLPSRLVSKPKNPPPPPPKSKPIQPSTIEFTDQKKTNLKEKPPPPLPFQHKLSSTEDKLFADTFNDFHVDISTSVKSDDLPKTGFDFLDNW